MAEQETSSIVDVTKMEANRSVESARIRTSEIGNPYLKAAGSWIQNEMRRELAAPYNLITYDKMRQDATVGAALGTAEAFLTKALANAKFTTNSKNPQARKFCDYLNWNFRNLKETTWYETCINILTYLQYGFSWVEKVYEPNTSTKYSEYAWKLKKLAPRAQQSVAEWKFDEAQRQVIGLRQWPPHPLNLGYTQTYGFSTNPNDFIKRNKFMLFSWDSKNSNPLGTSPLNACYRAWKEKTLIEAIECTGISKGLNGVIVARIPSEVINAAAADPESNQASLLASLQEQLALLHNGDQTYILLASDVGEVGNKYLFDFELKGVDGKGSQQVSTVDFINERKKAILDVFGAGFINLGNDSVGSYSLADAKTSLHAFFMEKHMLFIQSVIQNDLVKQMMEINRVYDLEEDDIPVFTLAALDEINPDEFGKLGQRLGAVGLMPLQKEFLIDFWQKCGLNTASLEDLPADEILEMLTAFTSRAGDGMAEGMNSGTGSSLGNNSATNSENAA